MHPPVRQIAQQFGTSREAAKPEGSKQPQGCFDSIPPGEVWTKPRKKGTEGLKNIPSVPFTTKRGKRGRKSAGKPQALAQCPKWYHWPAILRTPPHGVFNLSLRQSMKQVKFASPGFARKPKNEPAEAKPK